MAHLRLVPPSPASALAHTNRMGVTYFLHQGTTKTGKPKYFFAKTAGRGALDEMPNGFEVSESINGVVSVRRKTVGAAVVPDEDVKAVEVAVGRHPHLRGYVVRTVGNAVVIFEPHPRPTELLDLAQRLGVPDRAASFVQERMKKAQYRADREVRTRGALATIALRMTYRGKGGWSWPLQAGELRRLAVKFVPSIRTEEFFELM